MKAETIAIHAGMNPDQQTGAVVQPITLSTTFLRNEEGGYTSGFQYSRANNPNRQALEKCLAALEQGEEAAAFGSGNAAAYAVFQCLSPGDHVIVPDDMYHGISALLKEVYVNWGLEVSFVDLTDLKALENALRKNTRLIWIETPSNPLLKITDIHSVCRIAKAHNIITVCDNTFSTPILQSPLLLGCDLVMHATTKYLGGHSDILGGAIVSKANDAFFERIRTVQKLGGGVPSPFDCFLLVRGIKTLPYRMRAHSENAGKLAEFLHQHSNVEKVFYPGLKSHLAHNVASAQMTAAGGMLSFLYKGTPEETRQVANRTKLFFQATSLGGVESLIEHRASVEGPDTKTPLNLLRVSVGLEHIEDLIADIDQALK